MDVGRLFRGGLGVCAVALVLLTGGCGHGPIDRKLDQLPYYFDNALAFQPDRIWRLHVRWQPYLLDRRKAMLVKQFQLVVHGDRDRKRVENEILGRGGDERYLRWLEAELFPIGNWEMRDDARVSRLTDGLVISLRTHALKEVPISGLLDIRPVWFPDPLIRAMGEGCYALDWDIIPKDTSVGFEVVLESREDKPNAERWKTREFDSPIFWWRQWSVGQEHSISYRTVMRFKSNVSRCPLPPDVFAQLKVMRRSQETGVDW